MTQGTPSMAQQQAAAEKVAEILKHRFPNLTVEETLKITHLLVRVMFTSVGCGA